MEGRREAGAARYGPGRHTESYRSLSAGTDYLVSTIVAESAVNYK